MATKTSAATKTKMIHQNPLIMRSHRLMEAFAKSDDERDFHLDRQEGFLVYVDLDKSQEELDELEKELKTNADRYCAVPKLTFYEIKKLMEGFVHEKVYDIDTKEKLLDIIQSKEARENFLEFIYDHHSELEKWQQFYQEKFKIRIIEWLRNNQFDFVFEEDLELMKSLVEKLKMNTFTPKVAKDIASARKVLVAKAKTYYSSEALNPRPKRGRPPKQVAKVETEPQFSLDIYLTIPKPIKPFLYAPEYQGSASIFTFSGKFATEADLLAHKKSLLREDVTQEAHNLQQKLTSLRTLSSQWMSTQKDQQTTAPTAADAELVEPSKKEKVTDRAVKATAPEKARPVKEVAKAKATIAEKKQEEKPKKKETKFAPAAPTRLAPTKAKPAPSKPVFSKPVFSKTSSKPVAKPLAKPSTKKAPPKARLRPLVKKKPAPPASKEKEEKKKKQPLRHLRRSQK